MTADQLTAGQRTYEWGGFDMLDGQGWGFGLCVEDDGELPDGTAARAPVGATFPSST